MGRVKRTEATIINELQYNQSIQKIETALLAGYSHVILEDIKIPLSSWELEPLKTRKQKEEQAHENAINIINLLNSPVTG